MTVRACGCRTSSRGEPTTYCDDLTKLQGMYRSALDRYIHAPPGTDEGNAASDRLREINKRISAHWRLR